jgi:amino acid permease
MFDTLADRIKQDDGSPAKKSELIVRFLMIVLVAVVLFGGLYMVVQHLE